MIKQEIDWLRLAPLRIRARAVADGIYTGNHRSWRKGAGVEFGGFREYVPGDDLRRLDRRSALRHERLLIREFEMDTERPLVVVLDTTASMGYAGQDNRGVRPSKMQYASILAAALTRVAVMNGDRVALHLLGSETKMVSLAGGAQAFERVCDVLESIQPGGDVVRDATLLERSLVRVARSAKRGSVVVFFSDFFDLPERAKTLIGAFALSRRTLLCGQVLDPDEILLPFEGGFRLRAMEGTHVVDADESVREEYQVRLAALTQQWNDAVLARGGRFTRVVTTDDPVDSARRMLSL